MKNLLDKIFPTLSDELIIVISLIIGLLVTASLILFLVKKISPKTNISELAARTRSWWIMAGMFIGAVFISYNISYFFLAFLSFIAFRELYSVLGFREADRGALFWGILSIPIQYYLAYLAWYGALSVTLLISCRFPNYRDSVPEDGVCCCSLYSLRKSMISCNLSGANFSDGIRFFRK